MLVSHHEIDRSKWNELASHAQFPFFMQTEYLDACWPNWDALVLGDYEAVLPIKIHKKFIWKFSLHPLFIRSIEVLGDTSKSDLFIKWLRKNVDFLKLCFPDNYAFLAKSEINRIFQILDLKSDYLSIKKNYSENVRRKLKTFEKSGLQVVEGSNQQELLALFEAEKAHIYEQMNSDALQRLSNLMANYLKNGKGKLLEIRKENQLLAAAFFIIEGNKTLYLKGIVNPEGKQIGAMQALFDAIIQLGANKWESFDFGGSNDENLALFNCKFGAIDNNYVLLKMNQLPWPLRVLADKK